MMKTMEEIVESVGGRDYERLTYWKNFIVYNIIFDGCPNIGTPLFILEGKNERKLATRTESFEIMSVIDYDKDE